MYTYQIHPPVGIYCVASILISEVHNTQVGNLLMIEMDNIKKYNDNCICHEYDV